MKWGSVTLTMDEPSLGSSEAIRLRDENQALRKRLYETQRDLDYEIAKTQKLKSDLEISENHRKYEMTMRRNGGDSGNATQDYEFIESHIEKFCSQIHDIDKSLMFKHHEAEQVASYWKSQVEALANFIAEVFETLTVHPNQHQHIMSYLETFRQLLSDLEALGLNVPAELNPRHPIELSHESSQTEDVSPPSSVNSLLLHLAQLTPSPDLAITLYAFANIIRSHLNCDGATMFVAKEDAPVLCRGPSAVTTFDARIQSTLVECPIGGLAGHVLSSNIPIIASNVHSQFKKDVDWGYEQSFVDASILLFPLTFQGDVPGAVLQLVRFGTESAFSEKELAELKPTMRTAAQLLYNLHMYSSTMRKSNIFSSVAHGVSSFIPIFCIDKQRCFSYVNSSMMQLLNTKSSVIGISHSKFTQTWHYAFHDLINSVCTGKSDIAQCPITVNDPCLGRRQLFAFITKTHKPGQPLVIVLDFHIIKTMVLCPDISESMGTFHSISALLQILQRQIEVDMESGCELVVSGGFGKQSMNEYTSAMLTTLKRWMHAINQSKKPSKLKSPEEKFCNSFDHLVRTTIRELQTKYGDFHMKKCFGNLYEVGTRKLRLFDADGYLCVRIGGRQMTLEAFVRDYL